MSGSPSSATDPDPATATSHGSGWGDVLRIDRYPSRDNFELKQAGLDHHCITYILSEGRLSQTRGGQTFTSVLRRDSLLIRPAHQEAEWTGQRPAHARLRIAKGLIDSTWLELGSQPSRPAELLTIFSDYDPFVSRLAVMLLDELEKKVHPSQRLLIDSAAAMLAAHLVRRYCSTSATPQHSHPRLSPRCIKLVREYVEQSDTQSTITLDTLAGLCNLSPFHFARAFRMSVGLSPMQFVEQCRMDRAINLMRLGNLQVNQIAAAVGYADPSHFARRFAVFAKCSPRIYMRSLRSQISVSELSD